MKYPIGIQTFAKIREENYLYVDKTRDVYQLVKDGGYFFISRPRRFGKSLLVTTLEAYFQGRKELFEGLAISKLETEWKEYPVLHIDLNAERYSDTQALISIMNRHLHLFESVYGQNPLEKTLADRFIGIIRRAYEHTGRQVVILVDEYDKPLLEAIGNPELQNDYRKILKSVYGVGKTMDSYIRFALFTGVTKFSKVSVFSDLNNLKDISLDHRYNEICGVTEQEIHADLDVQVGEMAEANGMSKDECYEKLKKQYDGYHFSKSGVGIYNPFSLLNALDSRDFGDYWFATGTPTFLVETMKRNHYDLERLTREDATADLLGSLDSIDTNPIPLLYQSGYLTVKGYDSRFMTYRLGFPNEEVERGFSRFLFRYYTPASQGRDSFIKDFVMAIEAGQIEKFMSLLESLFAGQDYQLAGDAELYFHNAVALIFKMVGFYTDTERHTSDGRMDMVVQTADYIYIFEFKLDKSADEALAQIEEKQYTLPFANDPRKLYKIGVNFSSETRRIESWKVVER
ncbi:MAG: ATP-binding protein [Bacteroidales bacterium]|nr:ATP-binding protein [Bacteroidales bacterium]